MNVKQYDKWKCRWPKYNIGLMHDIGIIIKKWIKICMEWEWIMKN